MSWYYSKAAPAYDADAQNYFDQIAIAGSSIGDSTKTAINDFVLGLKDDGDWSSMGDIGPLCGDDLTGALVKLKKLSSGWSYTNQNFVGGDYSQSTGLAGNGTTKYLQTGVVISSISPASSSIAVYDKGAPNSTNLLHGAIDNVNKRFVFYSIDQNDTLQSSAWATGNNYGTAVLTGNLGFVGTSQEAAGATTNFIMRGTSSIASNNVLGTQPDNQVYFYAVNNNGVVAFPGSGRTLPLQFLYIGPYHTSTAFARISARVASLQTALGRA